VGGLIGREHRKNTGAAGADADVKIEENKKWRHRDSNPILPKKT
jgi:hypothetical protein